jgi:hypothetical protein
MKTAPVILLTASLPFAAWAANNWTGLSSTTLDAPGNWDSVPADLGATADIRIEGYTTNCPFWPVIDSTMNHQWGVPRVRGPGLRILQTGGTHEWLNGSGISSKGITIFSRPAAYPAGNSPTNPAVVRLTGGTMITDSVGVGTGGGLNSGSFYSVADSDYTADTGTYRNWQTNPGDNLYGWGRLEIAGTATFIVRPNRVVYPSGYGETNAYWAYDSAGVPTADKTYRVYDVCISTNSQIVISDFGKLIAPHKIFTNAILDVFNDRDLLTQLRYYAGLIEAGSPPHFVANGGLSGPRLVAGPGQTLKFDLFPAGTNEVNEPYGGYFTVTAVPAPVEIQLLSAGSLAVSGFVGRDYQVQSKDELTSEWAVRTNFTLTVSPQTWNDPTSSTSNRFYRAALLPLP